MSHPAHVTAALFGTEPESVRFARIAGTRGRHSGAIVHDPEGFRAYTMIFFHEEDFFAFMKSICRLPPGWKTIAVTRAAAGVSPGSRTAANGIGS
jgi:hypothetical protein